MSDYDRLLKAWQSPFGNPAEERVQRRASQAEGLTVRSWDVLTKLQDDDLSRRQSGGQLVISDAHELQRVYTPAASG